MVLHSSLFSVLSDQLISGSLITSRDSILERPSNLQADQLIVQYIWQDIKVSSDHHSANHQLILNSNVSSYLLITKPSFIARQRKHSRKRRKKNCYQYVDFNLQIEIVFLTSAYISCGISIYHGSAKPQIYKQRKYERTMEI